MQASKLGFGVVGATDIEVARAIARRAEDLGFHSLWFNDGAGGESLLRVAAATEVTAKLILGTGVIAVDRKPASEIVAQVRHLGIPLDRLILGIGSAAKPSPLTRVRESLSELHDSLDVTTVVGSLGPKMRELGAKHSDGLLFNWLPPEFARQTTAEMRAHASEAGNHSAMSATYIRTALGAESLPRLKVEADRYTAIPSYGANFVRLGITAMQGSVYADTPEGIREGLAEFDGTVDHAIVRAITANDRVDEYVALLEAVAPLI